MEYERWTFSDLKNATCSGNAEKLKKLLDCGAPANWTDENKNSLLHFASQFAQYNIINMLLESGANPNQQNKKGSTPLHAALVGKCTPEILLLFKKYKTIFNSPNKNGTTPLMLAAKNQINPDIISMMLVFGANINQKNRVGRTPLMFAATNQYTPRILEMLLNHGADPNIQDKQGLTALMCAAMKSNGTETISLLINANADPLAVYNSHDSILSIAAERGNTDQFKILLNYYLKKGGRVKGLDRAFQKATSSEIRQLLKESDLTSSIQESEQSGIKSIAKEPAIAIVDAFPISVHSKPQTTKVKENELTQDKGTSYQLQNMHNATGPVVTSFNQIPGNLLLPSGKISRVM